MIQLNLLPPKVRAAELLGKIVFAAAVAYVLAFAWLGWQWSVGHVKLRAALRDVAQVQAQLNAPKLQAAVAAVQKFADDMTAVKAKASVVNALRQQQVPLLRLLDSVPDWTMNGRVWLLALDAQPGKAVRRGGQAPGLSVSLFGAALSRGAFADYYDFMGDQPMVNELTLDTPPLEAELRGVKVVQFKLAFSVPDLP